MHGVAAAAVLTQPASSTHLLPLSGGRWRGMEPRWGQVGWHARQCCVGDVTAVPTQLAWLTCHQPLFGGRRAGGWGTGAGRSAVNPMRGGGEVAGIPAAAPDPRKGGGGTWPQRGVTPLSAGGEVCSQRGLAAN
jgi:hypothetical protein